MRGEGVGSQSHQARDGASGKIGTPGLDRASPESSLIPTRLSRHWQLGSQIWGWPRSGGGRAALPSRGSSSLEGSHPPKPPANSLALLPSHPQSLPCRRPLYLAVQRHPHFQGLFDFSTPVLLSGGVFTQELWDHLSQHKAPYGWQGLSRQGNLRPLPAADPLASAGPFFLLLALCRPGPPCPHGP